MIVEAAGDGDLRERHLPGIEEVMGSVNPEPHDELMRRNTDGGAKEPRKMEWTDVRKPRHRDQRRVFVKV